MKPTYNGFEAKKANNYTELPPVGAYIAEIKNAEEIDIQMNGVERKAIEVFLDIAEGDYKGRYMAVWQDRKERFGDKVTYNGSFKLIPPIDGDDDWRKRVFESNLWCVQESNPGYAWDWDEKKLKGKKVGINLRAKLYEYEKDGEWHNAETTEIGKFETVADVKSGKCKPMRERNTRKHENEVASTDGSNFTEVSGKSVDVPW